MSTAVPLDPMRSLSDLATLMARLADPFAKRADVLASVFTNESAVESAQIKWASELKSNETLARLYGEIFARERARLRGEPDKPVPPPPAAAPPARLLPPDPPPATAVDETAMLPRLTLGSPALPFVDGKFEPPKQPVEPRQERANDPDGTQLHVQVEIDTLPFVRILPSQTLKKKT
jgi:hypothetical protein